MQDVGEPFGGIEAVKDHEHCKPDRVGKFHVGIGVNIALARELRQVLGRSRFLNASLARAQRVEANASDNRCEPTAHIVHNGGIKTAQTKPSLLYGVVRVAGGAKHAVGHVT
jgi:hypothetical protein